MLSAFISKRQLWEIFGKNLFDDKSLKPLFEELLGIKRFKPFECVGEPEEVKKALSLASKRREFKGSYLMDFYEGL